MREAWEGGENPRGERKRGGEADTSLGFGFLSLGFRDRKRGRESDTGTVPVTSCARPLTLPEINVPHRPILAEFRLDFWQLVCPGHRGTVR